MTLHDTPARPPGAENGASNGARNGAADGGYEGGEYDAEPARPPSPKGVSMKLAMIVPGLGALILALFITTEFLTANPVQQGPAKASSAVVAGGLHSTPAAGALKPIIVLGQPPTNIVDAVEIPQASVAVSNQNNTAAAEQYDAQVELRVGATQGALRTFFLAAMKKQGWQIISQGAASHNPGAIQVLGKLAGDDGYYWEMGAVIEPTTFPAGAPPTGDTDYTVRLFQLPDDST